MDDIREFMSEECMCVCTMVCVAVVQLAEHCFQFAVSCTMYTCIFATERQPPWMVFIIVMNVMVVIAMLTILVIIVVS